MLLVFHCFMFVYVLWFVVLCVECGCYISFVANDLTCAARDLIVERRESLRVSLCCYCMWFLCSYWLLVSTCFMCICVHVVYMCYMCYLCHVVVFVLIIHNWLVICVHVDLCPCHVNNSCLYSCFHANVNMFVLSCHGFVHVVYVFMLFMRTVVYSSM